MLGHKNVLAVHTCNVCVMEENCKNHQKLDHPVKFKEKQADANTVYFGNSKTRRTTSYC